MPLDPQARQLLQVMAESGTPPLHQLTPAEARQAHAEQTPALAGAGPKVGAVTDERIATNAGDLQVRIYRPSGLGPFPVLVYLHGGGWVVGTLDTYDALCRHLTVRADCLTVSVAYRLAPEHRHPAALEDAYAATCWSQDHAAFFAGDPGRLGVAGDSAGGHLAGLVAARAADHRAPQLSFQVLLYPALDPTMRSESVTEFAEGYYLSREELCWCWNHYLGPEDDWDLSEVSPLHRSDLRGLPRTLLIVAGHDPLRDEGVLYAKRLESAGVPTLLRNYHGMIHGFVRFLRRFDTAHDAIREVATFVRKATDRRVEVGT
ncbi:MAG: alpha/beta hydrolase, partial [Actinomycetota bacterium]|nr:alpha/beta hydrolase [Actinomycetota bacterium]